jgi:serine/threonine protein kinase
MPLQLVGSTPFNSRDPDAIIEKIAYGKLKLPKYLSPQAKDFISCALIRTGAKRPKIVDLMDHPWVRKRGSDEMTN